MDESPKNGVCNSESMGSPIRKVTLVGSSHSTPENTNRRNPNNPINDKGMSSRSTPNTKNSRISSTRSSPNVSPYSTSHLSGSSSVLRRSALLRNMESSRSLASTNERVNPFEENMLSSLGKSMWSPTIFENVHMGETPPQKSWTLDQLANLFPKNFENSPSSHTNAFPVDSFTEAKAQADIDRFFNSGPIAPSPEDIIPRPRGLLQSKFNKSKELCVSDGITTTVWTNTELSLPFNLPPELEIALKPYYQNTIISEVEPDNPDLNSSKKELNISASSVRRRLDLSFGESSFPEDSSSSFTTTNIPYGDPFGSNHRISSPPQSFSNMLSFSSPCPQETSTSDLECRFRRCEFTPNRMESSMISPNITPIGSEESHSPKGFEKSQKKMECPDITPILIDSTHAVHQGEEISSNRGLKRKSMLHLSTNNVYSSTPTGRRSSVVKFRRNRAGKMMRFSTDSTENMDCDTSVKKQSRSTRKSCPSSTIVGENDSALTLKSKTKSWPIISSCENSDFSIQIKPAKFQPNMNQESTFVPTTTRGNKGKNKENVTSTVINSESWVTNKTAISQNFNIAASSGQEHDQCRDKHLSHFDSPSKYTIPQNGNLRYCTSGSESDVEDL